METQSLSSDPNEKLAACVAAAESDPLQFDGVPGVPQKQTGRANLASVHEASSAWRRSSAEDNELWRPVCPNAP